MKSNYLVCFLIFTLTFVSFVGVFNSVQAETWTDITLPYTITSGGNYRITQAYTGSGVILAINASNVVVDGQDQLIQSTQATDDQAIKILQNCTNILLKNINQTGSDYGLYAVETKNLTVEDSTFENNTSTALFAFNVTDLTLQHSRLSNNSNGFVAIDSINLNIAHSHIKNNTCGVQPVLCSNITIQQSYLNNNTRAVQAMNCTNLAIRDSEIITNFEGVVATFTDFSIDNVNVSNNSQVGITCLYGNLQAANFAADNNIVGLYSILSTFNATYASLCNNTGGIFAVVSNATVTDCAFHNNLYVGAYAVQCNSTIFDDCGLSNNTFGLEIFMSQNVVIENSLIANNSIGAELLMCEKLLVTGNIFDKNGLTEEDPYAMGALVAEDTNCTVTNNAFTNNNDALLLGVFSSELNNTQTYLYNSFVNNSYTFDFNYRLPSNFSNQQIHFYNNLVNDTAYLNPQSFYAADYYAPCASVFHLNTTLQAGERAYSNGRMIGGNYWAHPNGTGFSENATDADTDGFADTAFDFFGNQTVYDYLPYTSDYVENVTSLTISPSSVTVKAGQNVTFTTTAHDKYGNAWTVEPLYILDSAEYISSRFIGYYADTYFVAAVYGGQTAYSTVTVTPGDLTRYAVFVPSNAKPNEAFAVRVVALDHYGNVVTDFDGSVTLSISDSSISPTSTGAFTDGIWRGNVTISQAGTYTLTATDSDGNNGTSSSFTIGSQQTSNPTPIPTPTVKATKDDGSKVNLGLGGNITSTQISDLTITTDDAAHSIVVSLTVTGLSGNSGFCNLTIPKSSVDYGTAPIVLIDGETATDQGFTEDSQNYYVWFTTGFSTHQVQIQFKASSIDTADSNWWVTPAAVIVVVVLVIVGLAVLLSKRKRP